MREPARALRLAAALVAGGLLLAARGRPEGPQPIAWDREPCAHCRRLISDPAFAAQLHRSDGTVESFDDPGCLLARLAAPGAPVAALWFHHVREARWLPGDAVAFERVARTPMDLGPGAIGPDTPGAPPLHAPRAAAAA